MPGRRLAPDILAGLGWKAVSQAVGLVMRLAGGVVVARLLGPGELGLAAMALAFSALGGALADAALGSALVRRTTLTETDRSTAFWLSAIVGATLCVSGVALSGAVAAFYGRDEVRALFAVLSCGFLIGALASTPAALLTRELRFRALELARVAAAIGGTAVAITVAATGGGAWAVVAQQLTGLAVIAALVWLAARWRPRLVLSRRTLRELGGFGLNVLGARVFFYLQRNADSLLVGRELGAAPLGAYALAYNLMLQPFVRLVDPLRAVLYPAFARVQEDRERLAALWLRAIRALTAVMFPAMVGIAVVAGDLVTVALGDRWTAAVGPIRLLALVGLLQATIALNSTVLTALDRTGQLLRFAALTFALSLAGFVAGLPYGITGVAAGYLAANVVMVPIYVRVAGRAAGVELRSFAAALAGPAQATAGMVAIVVPVQAALAAAGAAAGVRLAAVALAGAAIAAGLTAWRAPELVRELRALPRLARARA